MLIKFRFEIPSNCSENCKKSCTGWFRKLVITNWQWIVFNCGEACEYD